MRPLWQQSQEQRHPDEAFMPPRRRGATRHTCHRVHSCHPAPMSPLSDAKDYVHQHLTSAIDPHLLWNSGGFRTFRTASEPSQIISELSQAGINTTSPDNGLLHTSNPHPSRGLARLLRLSFARPVLQRALSKHATTQCIRHPAYVT